MREEVLRILKKALKELDINVKEEELSKYLEIPKSSDLGDYAFPCFFLSKLTNKSPHEIAMDVRVKIGNAPKGFDDIQIQGPYLNFFIDRKSFAFFAIQEILKKKDKFGVFPKNKKTIMVEFPSPNTNKPLHLGHLRNMAIGESVCRILENSGYKIIRANLNNDRGIHICKSMAAYDKYGKGKTPEKENKKSDHFVGDYYVMFNEKSKRSKTLEVLSHRMLQKYEEGDEKVLSLWKKMNKWALDGFKNTYKKFGISHEVVDFESKIYKKGKQIVMDGLKKEIFQRDKTRAVVVNLKDKKLGEKVLIRSDGTSIYITQDIYLAKSRFEKYGLDKIIYVVGNEQNYHFDVLFEILEMLEISKKDKLTHLNYGMVFLPEGKMKSREGIVVDADDIIDKVQKLVEKELKKRYDLTDKELEGRSSRISLAAIKYLLLKTDSKKNMVFDPKKSISFEGDTGPYIQYSYARASSILKKAKAKGILPTPKKLEKKEVEIVKKLSTYPEIMNKSANELNPSLIANYAYELAQIFNEFYHDCPVIRSDNELFRLKIVEAFRQVLKNALHTLGIDILEEM
jgi:arginyl-tRNA synthetase